MKLVVLLAVLSASLAAVAAEPAGQRRSTASPRPDPVEARGAQPVPAAPDKIAEAYGQFLLARHLKDAENIDGAIAAFKRAIEFDPQAADVVAELASLYMQQNRFDEAVATRTRKVALRSAMTLSPDSGGVFDALVGLVRRGLGGSAGDGRQYMSWVHYEDFVAAVRWLIERDDVDGVVNVASPNPLPNAEFMRLLREAFGVSFGLPAREWMLEIGAVLMRTETELILKSRRVVPGRLLDRGFTFKHPEWNDAARDLCHQWKIMRAGCLRTA